MKTLVAAVALGIVSTVVVAQTAPAKPAAAPAPAKVDCKDAKNKDKPECKAPAKK